MSEIDDTEKSLRDFAALRQNSAGTAPLRIPGPMRERLRIEIEAMSDCDSVFERKSGFGIGALLRILIPTAAVAAVTVVSFHAWDFESSASSSARATASLQKEEVDRAVAPAAPSEKSKEATDSSAFAAQPPARARTIVAQPPVPVVATSAVPSAAVPNTATTVVGTGARVESEVAGEVDGLTIAMNRSQASRGIALERVTEDEGMITGESEFPLAQPSTPGYGEPREATLAPTVPVDMDKQLNEPVNTVRFRSTAPGSILSEFVLRRVGDMVELTDSDGSRYTAEVVMEERLKRKNNEMKKSDRSSEVKAEHFTVSGTNQTIGRKVLITGSIFESPLGTSDMSSTFRAGDARVATGNMRIHAVIRIEGQKDPISIEADIEK